MKFALTYVSSNSKTGPIPTVVISNESCPTVCPLKNSGCYAELGPLGFHWNKVNGESRGKDFQDFINDLKQLPRNQLWRYAVAGDLPGKGNRINHKELINMVSANRSFNGRGFTYTHKPLNMWKNKEIIEFSGENGFTINLSSNNLDHADELYTLSGSPVVTLVPNTMGQIVEYKVLGGKSKQVRKWKHTLTSNGNLVVQCPAEYNSTIQCINCGNGKPFCQRWDRDFIVGFTVHGVRKKKANAIARLPILE